MQLVPTLNLPLVWLTVFGALCATSAAAQETTTLEVRPVEGLHERCQAIVERIVERGAPGASAALVLPDGTLLACTAGLASRAPATPMTPETLMLSGSAGKTFVAGAVLLLASRGQLDLDARAADYFEGDQAAWADALPNGRAVTLRQLLRHQSGIPRYVFEAAFTERMVAEPDRVWQPRELLAFVSQRAPLFAPGESFSYADTNYIVVGMVIEAVAGDPFYTFVQRELLAPHELDASLPSNRREIPGMAQGHVQLGRSMGVPELTLEDGRFVFNVQFEWCGGGWANTPGDLARYCGLLYSGTLFEGQDLAALLEAVPAPELGPQVRYGIAAMLRETSAGPLIHHDGFMPGYLTSTGFFPELELAVALQLNSDDARPLGKPPSEVLAELALAATSVLEEAR